jgi:hypothetical protein
MGRKGQTKYDINIGDVVGTNTILKIKDRLVTVQCKCGSSPRVMDIWYVLEKRKCTECGNRRMGRDNPSFAGFEDIRGNWPEYLTKRNKKLGFADSDVDFNYLWELFLSQNRKCALTGMDLTFHGNRKSSGGFERTSSLDRIDSTKGYFKDNIQWVHKHVNHMKNKYDQTYFIMICKLVSETVK